MKKLLILLLLPALCRGQKIAENKIDEFTKHHVVRTEWELLDRSDGFYTHVRISNIDRSIYLNLKWLHNNEIGAITEGTRIMLKMSNDSIVTLQTLKSVVSCIGCGAVGFAGSTGYGYELTCSLEPGDLAALSAFAVKKIRIYLDEGYEEHEIKEKNSQVLMREILLMNATL